MLFRTALGKKSAQDSLKAFFFLFLLISYTVGNIQVEAFHRHFHAQDNIDTHSFQEEKDPCHRTLYHHEKNYGCKHKLHLKKADKCSLCHIFYHSDQITFSDSSCEFIQSGFIVAEKFISVQLADIDNNLPSRAPPFI